MPTLLNWRRYKLLFYSREPGEPPHVHVLKGPRQLKVWLSDLTVARNAGFADHEVNAILKKEGREKDHFTKAWYDFFGNR
ncbi:MAG: DUF4160 domain-containing protein [Ahrensia sp.]|nr:DUF4160 domain-containing protein [Ahrensia sp.]